ncbi:MAG: hypothetical protein ACI3YI_00870 [Bacteroidaceae bacterium]
MCQHCWHTTFHWQNERCHPHSAVREQDYSVS